MSSMGDVKPLLLSF